ncbi:hypothetical protein JYT20_01650 [Rhodothermus sp. AH-315-K08]|nr:hypothetical protein [Rhodothermus sp. AH-315-K08]
MASLVKRGSTYYAQWHNARRNPSRKRLSLRTGKVHEARKIMKVLDGAYATGEWDPWIHGLDKAFERPEAPVTVAEATRRFLGSKERTVADGAYTSAAPHK